MTTRNILTLGLLALITLAGPFTTIQVQAASNCSASQTPVWQICGPIQSSNGLNVEPSVIQASDGTLKMAWAARPLTSYIIQYSSGSWNGTGWNWGGGASPTTQGGTNLEPTLAQLPNGTIYLFWAYKASTSRHYQVFYLTQNAGVFTKTYTPLPLANPTTLNDTFPSASVAKDGTLWLVWSRDNTTASGTSHVMRQLWYETLAPGATRFSTEQPLTSATDPNWNFQPSVLVGKDRVVRVAFSRGAAASGIYDIYLMTYNGSVWSSPIQMTTQATTTDGNPSVMQDRNGTIWIFWGRNVAVSSNLVSVIYETSSLNNGSTWTSETALTAATCSSNGCIDSEYPAAVQAIADKNIWVFYATDPSTNFAIYGLETTHSISPVHDVSISYFSPNASQTYAGGYYNPYTPSGVPIYQSPVIQILVALQNPGDYAETVTLSMKATNATNIYNIGTQTLSINAGASYAAYFNFNTTHVKPARYGVSGNASIPVETIGNKLDGLLSTKNLVHLLPLGDVDQDGSVTITDVTVVFYNYGFSCYTPSTCSPRYINAIWGAVSGSGIIDISDASVVANNYGIYT